jgi:type III pantothenate kinase
MNIIAIDIGNTNVRIGLFLRDKKEFIQTVSGTAMDEIKTVLSSAWERIPKISLSNEGKRDGVLVVSSVKPAWTKQIARIVKQELDEDIKVVGRDIPLPISAFVDDPSHVGTDRLVAAAAAYAVVENAAIVIDVGTAVTIDLVDEHGIFQGGVIFPGLELGACALQEHTAQLPKVEISRPEAPYGKNSADAINCGLYYSLVGTLEEIIRRYAETLGTWPQTVITGAGAELIREDCQFIDSYVPDLVVHGIVLAHKKHLEGSTEVM